MTLPSLGVSTWRLPLRLARRDALRHRARSALVLVMIALPVLAVTAADVLLQTSTVSGPESVDRRMGAAEALISVTEGTGKVAQPPDPDSCCPYTTGGHGPVPTADQISSLLDGAPLVELRRGEVDFKTPKGQTPLDATEVDLRDAATRGLFHLSSGRLPRDAGEVVVNQSVLDFGYRVGEPLDLAADGGVDPTIVGVAESSTLRSYPTAAGPIGSLAVETHGTTQWLASGGPVSWATVRQLNEIGATVASRAVIDHPPPESQWPPEVQQNFSSDSSSTVAVVALIVTMALIEVVLLAGPAFAVTARKQQRSLALMAATGGTPTQSRRVVVASAVVLGGAAALAGVALGIGVARLLQPLLQHRSDQRFGPFEVPWVHLWGVAGFGLLSAFLAAVVPAHLASRQDVVAVLAGRRGDRPPSLRSPLLGLALVGVGVLLSVLGSTQESGEFLIAASAIPTVLGMVLLVPVVLTGLAKLSGRLPLVLRYAVRDANRHRTRTVPAVAAVAATVAGVVALGIALSSDQAENRETYQPSVAAGIGIVTSYPPPQQGDEPAKSPPWSALRAVVARELPDAAVTDQVGLSESSAYAEVLLDGASLLSSYSSSVGSGVMVSDDALPPGLIGISKAEAARAAAALRGGGVVAFSNTERGDGQVTVLSHSYDDSTGADTLTTRTKAAATFITVPGAWSGPAAVISPGVAAELGAKPTTVALAVSGHITAAEQESVNEGLAAVAPYTSMYVERGYQPDDAAVIVQLVLVLLGAVLMLGGTLTATFLALSDARPDLATLSAVGASPRTRRGVAAAYAVVVGSVGAFLGAVVGLIPGIAVTRPLTRVTGNGPGLGATGPFLDIPWLTVLVLVAGLPCVTALVVGLFARSRLPLVARLD